MSRHRIELGAGLTLSQPLAIGTLQWGTTPIDEHLINPGGCISERIAHDIVEETYAAGVTLFDSAEGYGGGTSEKRLGRAVAAAANNAPIRGNDAGNVDGFVIMTKFLPTFWRYSHACFETALRASNARLGIECCPLYLLHTPVHWRPIEFWVEAAAICKRKGLLNALGLSNCNAEQVRRAHDAGTRHGVPVIVNQVMFSLLDAKSPKLMDMEKAATDLGVTIIAYSPLGGGLLTDGLTREKFDATKQAKMLGLTWDGVAELRGVLQRVASEQEATMAQVALAWCMKRGTVPLVGCRSLAQARDSIGALRCAERLGERDVAALDAVALRRSTLESPRARRALFVVLAGVVMMACRACDFVGWSAVRTARG